MNQVALANEMGGPAAPNGPAIHHFSATGARDNPRLVCSAKGAAARFVLARLVDFLYKLQADEPEAIVRDLAIATNATDMNLPHRQQLMRMRHHARYCLSLDSSDVDMERLPQVSLDAANDDERSTACLFGLPAVVERVDSGDSMRLGEDWYGEQFVLQMGQAGQLNLSHCNTVFQSLLAFLSRSGLVEISNVENDDDLHFFGPDQLTALEAPESGLFVCRYTVGKWLHRGEYVGSVYDPSTGEEIAEVLAPVDGLITALRRTPTILAGDLLAEVGQKYGS